ncbi:hypothetical protein [Microcoleus sp. B7-D4]
MSLAEQHKSKTDYPVLAIRAIAPRELWRRQRSAGVESWSGVGDRCGA